MRTKSGMFCLIGWFKDAILERISSLCWIFITLDVRVGCFSELCGWIMYLFYNIYIEKFEKPGNEALPIQSDGYCCCHYTMTNIPLHHHHHLDGKRCYHCQHHHLFVIISKILVYNLSHCHHHRHPTWHSRYLLTCHCHTTITIFSAPTIALLWPLPRWPSNTLVYQCVPLITIIIVPTLLSLSLFPSPPSEITVGICFETLDRCWYEDCNWGRMN